MFLEPDWVGLKRQVVNRRTGQLPKPKRLRKQLSGGGLFGERPYDLPKSGALHFDPDELRPEAGFGFSQSWYPIVSGARKKVWNRSGGDARSVNCVLYET